ncbi:MAG: ATP-binding protein [Bacteroidales bacterium]
MASPKPENPFPVNTYLGPEYFCDRIDETNLLISNARNGSSTSLIAIRRIGKTGLIKHVLARLPKGWKGIYIDILETENLGQFLNMLATALLNSASEKSKPGRLLWEYIKSLRPVISFDSLTGSPQASFDLKPKEVEANIDAVLRFLDGQDHKILIAIDEFQQILRFPEKTTEAWLRSRIQRLKNCVFIFSGSEQHLMNELFTSPKKPFYRSTQLMKLGRISKESYRDFIVMQFRNYRKEISPAIAEQILNWTELHTYYVQQVCNRVFSATEKKVSAAIWQEQAYRLIREQEFVFFSFRNMLTNPQWQLLKAIAAEDIVYQPTASLFIQEHRLGNSATVLRSLNTLIRYELLGYEFDTQGRKYYLVNDLYFKRWVQAR